MSNKQVFRSHGLETIVERIPDGVDPREYMQQEIDNCPLCQEARARGELPQIHPGSALPPNPEGGGMYVMTTRPIDKRKPLFAKRPRWRTMKRRR